MPRADLAALGPELHALAAPVHAKMISVLLEDGSLVIFYEDGGATFLPRVGEPERIEVTSPGARTRESGGNHGRRHATAGKDQR